MTGWPGWWQWPLGEPQGPLEAIDRNVGSRGGDLLGEVGALGFQFFQRLGLHHGHLLFLTYHLRTD